MRATVLAAAAASLLFATTVRAQSFPARSGETGIIDVPDAEVVGASRGQLGVEIGVERTAGERADLAGLPIYVVGSLARRLDAGLTMRQIAEPGDPRPAQVAFGAAAKFQLVPPLGPVPGVALSTVLDRFNDRRILGVRLALSTVRLPFRIAAFGGGEATAPGFGNLRPTAGVAASFAVIPHLELAAEALAGGRGENLGGAIRWMATKTVGASIGVNWFPGDDAFRVALTLAFAPALKSRADDATAAPAAPAAVEKVASVKGPRFTEDRPHFRLRMDVVRPDALGAPRRLQHGPYEAPTAVAAANRSAPAAVKPLAPSLDDLAETQVREQEALADERERRVRATAEQLGGREKAALEEAKKLEEREREVGAREQQLDAREQRIASRGAPTQQQRQLESLEAQLGTQERQLLARERSFGPAIDAGQGRERDAAAREEAERQEASRLAASVSGAPSRTQQTDLRKKALSARNRQLAALEARLVATGERIDALERQLRAKGERLETFSRRLDTRAERLDLLEKRAAEPRPVQAPAKPSDTKAPTPKDKAAFVMVVKSPTAIVKERAAASAPAGGAGFHPGVAVEKAVAAATVVAFPTPASLLSDIDRDTIDNIAKLASKEHCELLIWARAKDPSLMAEAERRAGELRTRVLAIGPLDASQVVTRVTTRPGAQGVDVVVSALHETAKPTPAPAAAPATPTLLSGESGKRQIRESVVAAQPSIEACIGEHIEAKKLERAEGVLKLTVSTQGKVTRVQTGGGDLAGTEIEECLSRASGAWAFPAADAGYVVDVPITVIRGGAK